MDGAGSWGHGTAGKNQSSALRESWVRKRAQGGMLGKERGRPSLMIDPILPRFRIQGSDSSPLLFFLTQALRE